MRAMSRMMMLIVHEVMTMMPHAAHMQRAPSTLPFQRPTLDGASAAGAGPQ
jgi:hypothetical protein